MGDVLIRARGAELASGATRVAGLLAAGFPATRDLLQEFVAQPAVQGLMRPGLDSASASARLGGVLPESSDSVRSAAQLLDRAGRVIVESRAPTADSTPFTWASRAAAAGALDSTTLTVSPVLAVDSGEVGFGIAFPVRDASGGLRGWYAEARRARARGVDDVRALIGVQTMLVGTSDTGLWTDLENAAIGPTTIAALDTVLRVRSDARGRAIGLGTRIPGSPWVLWVEEPEEQVLAPVDALFARLWPAIALIAAFGAVLAWLLGRVAARRIRAVAAEIDRTLTMGSPVRDAATSGNAEDELAALERSYAQLETRLAQQRRLDEQLLQSQKLEAVGRMAGGIAHDFNNLLTVISNYGELVREQLPAASPESEDMAEVLRAADRAAALTRQLLAFSRQHLVDPQPLDINEAVVGADRMLTRLIPSNIERVLDLSSTPLVVTVDAVQLEQILMNLVLNAVDAMPAGGRLTVRTTIEELDPTSSSHEPLTGGAYACVTVADTGAGMDAETVARIFDPFFTTKAVGKGTGLGLATVHGIVTQAHGRVWAYSELGRGTTMKVYLPLSDAAVGTAGRTDRTARPRTPAHGVLVVVEDDEGTRAVTRRLVVQEGFRVEEFSRADAALEWLNRDSGAHEVRAVVSDVMMPGMSGIELARRAALRWPSLPFVLMSGYSDTRERLGDLPGPRPVILEKPFSGKALLDAVDRAVTR